MNQKECCSRAITIVKNGMQEAAKKRGLCNIASVPESLKSLYLTPYNLEEVLIGSGIFSEKELESRVEVEFEKFTKESAD